MRGDNNTRLIALTELLQQCVLFLSIVYTGCLGIMRMDYTHFADGLWIIVCVAAAFAARKLIRKFSLFMFSNILILIIAYLAGAGEAQVTLNMIVAFILCIYSTSLKNREVATYKDNSIPIREGQSAEMVRDAAMRALVARESVHIYLIAVIVVGYFIGSAAPSRLLMNIQGVLCILFVLLHILHNNLKCMKQECDLNGGKKNFPAAQMMSVSRFVTVISLVVISVVMLLFYNGYYGNVFGYIVAGFRGIIRVFLKALLFLMGLSGSRQTEMSVQEATEATEEAVEGLEMGSNDFMELLAEIFGVVLIVALLIGVVYIIKVYAANFNRVKKVGTDTVEYIKPSEKKSSVKSVDVMSMKNDSKSDKDIRKMYKKRVLSGLKGKKPDKTYTPQRLTETAVTQDKETALQITAIYEKARYSDETVSQEEYRRFKDLTV